VSTEDPITPQEPDSAIAVPSGPGRAVSSIDTVSSPVTTSTSEQSAYGKQIIIRGTDGKFVTLQLDVAREGVLQGNLIANRGPMKVNTTTEHEG
jgi:hypothetical protein